MKTLATDERGQNTRTALMLVIGVSISVLVGAVLLPTAIGQIEADTTESFNQTTNTDVQVNGELVSNVTATTSGSDATVQLNDTRTAGTTSNTINVGANATYNLNGGDVDVGVEEAGSGYAVVNYSYASDYAYSDGASSLWGLLGLSIVLALLLFLVGRATDYSP